MWENCGKNRISGAARSENRDAEREVPADEKSDRSSALGGSKLFNELSALLEKKRDKSERNREGDEVSVRFAIDRRLIFRSRQADTFPMYPWCDVVGLPATVVLFAHGRVRRTSQRRYEIYKCILPRITAEEGGVVSRVKF